MKNLLQGGFEHAGRKQDAWLPTYLEEGGGIREKPWANRNTSQKRSAKKRDFTMDPPLSW